MKNIRSLTVLVLAVAAVALGMWECGRKATGAILLAKPHFSSHALEKRAVHKCSIVPLIVVEVVVGRDFSFWTGASTSRLLAQLPCGVFQSVIMLAASAAPQRQKSRYQGSLAAPAVCLPSCRPLAPLYS